jgi:PAS domain S-box-containing protein
MPGSRHSTWRGYLIALAATSIAVLGRWFLDPWLGDYLPLPTLFGAVAIAVWFGGYRAAVLAVVVGYLASYWLFVDPRGQFAGVDSTRNLLGLAAYLFSCTIIIAFGEALRTARRRAEDDRKLVLWEAEERRKAEESLAASAAKETQALHKSEQRLRVAQSVGGVGVWEWDVRSNDLYWTPELEKIYGLPPGSVHVYDDFRRRIHPDDLAAAEAVRDDAIAQQRSFAMEFRAVRPDGDIIWILSRGAAEYDEAGIAARVWGVSLDITERKRAEQALRESEARFRTMANTSAVIIWVTDATGRVEFVNQAYRTYAGITDEDVQEHKWQLAIHPDDADRYVAEFLRCVRDNLPFYARCRIKRADGAWRWIESYGTPRFGPAGEFTGHVGSGLDIHDLVVAQDVLQEADRRKDEFIATLAHELRNPLAPILNAVEVLKARDAASQLSWARNVIERQTVHMARLLEDLLDVSRISRNRVELRVSRVQVAAVVESALETSRPLIDAGGHHFTVSLPTETIWIDTDPVRLAQVFSNLLNNAAKYTEKGGRIQFIVERNGSAVVASVRDDGIGIIPEMLPRVFDMFQQDKPALARSQGGLGIGLSLAKGLVEAMGGRIEVHSDGPGKGSTFSVHLRVAEDSTGERPRPMDEARNVASERRRFLIADDLQDSADSLAMMLELLGHDVQTAYDGEQAVAIAQGLRPDVAVLDLGMPKLNGYEVCRQIRAQEWGKRICVIALTGWGQDEDRRRTQAAGFDHHLVKPVEAGALMRLIASLPSPGPVR